MKIKTILVIALSSFVSSPVFAATYPTFAGITISKTTTAAEYVIYFFNLIVAVGALMAVVMIIMAGVEWVTSSGEPGKVESAKGKIKNTLLGVTVLVGCYLILNTINPQLTSIKIDDLRCEHGVVVEIKNVSGKIEEKCIDSNQGDIGGTITNTLKWKFPDKYLLKVYTYPEINYKGEAMVLDCRAGACSGSLSSTTKSIYFILNNPGIYLYDGTDYKPGVKSYPRFISKSVPDLTQLESFDNFTKSLEIINPDQAVQKIQYQAVVFKDQNYRGRCAFVGSSVPNMSADVNSYYTDSIKNNTISSIIIAKSNMDQAAISEDRGEIIFYTKTDCGKSSKDKTGQIKECHKKIQSSVFGPYNFVDAASGCGAGTPEYAFNSGDEVMSFEITGAGGLILSNSEKGAGTEYTYCQYYNKESLKGGTCYSSILDTPIFTVGGKTPKSFIIIPDN
jgi:hypothetical protein